MTDLTAGDLELLGRIMPASNHTFLAQLSSGERVVYKPVAGERPLWDFPHGTLAGREYAAHLVSEALGWGIVPPTVLREGPHGTGMVQLWREPAPGVGVVDVVPAGQLPEGWLHVLTAEDAEGRDVNLIHEDSAELLRMAVFDVITNNTDRKGGHILAMADGSRLGVDHGICFHVEDKLRTVLWGFAGRRLDEEIIDIVLALAADDSLLETLNEHLGIDEVEALRARCHRLVSMGVMPSMGPGWPAIPWPPF